MNAHCVIRMACALFMLGIANPVRALPFIIMGDGVSAGHYDYYGYGYFPLFGGWHPLGGGGDFMDGWGGFVVTTADGRTGPIRVTFTVTGSVSGNYDPMAGMYFDGDPGPILANFAGIAGHPTIGSSFTMTSSTLGYAHGSFSGPFPGGASFSKTVYMDTMLGVNNDMFLQVQHIGGLRESDFLVVDPTQPAGFGVVTFADVTMRITKIEALTDETPTVLVLLAGALALAFFMSTHRADHARPAPVRHGR